MVTEPPWKVPEENAAPQPVKDREDSLPIEFYIELLDLPRCKIDGSCDNCGRCEH